jgi:hypothetical protein
MTTPHSNSVNSMGLQINVTLHVNRMSILHGHSDCEPCQWLTLASQCRPLRSASVHGIPTPRVMQTHAARVTRPANMTHHALMSCAFTVTVLHGNPNQADNRSALRPQTGSEHNATMPRHNDHSAWPPHICPVPHVPQLTCLMCMHNTSRLTCCIAQQYRHCPHTTLSAACHVHTVHACTKTNTLAGWMHSHNSQLDH